MRHRAIVAFLLLVGFVAGYSQYYQQLNNFGGIDWTAQVVRATGIGAPNPNLPPGAQRASAIEAAKVVALRNILQIVKGVYVNSETTVENMMLTSDVIRTKVEGVVRNYRVVDIRYVSTGDVEVDVEVPLSAFYEIFLNVPQQSGASPAPQVCPLCGQPWPAGKPYPQNYPVPPPSSPSGAPTPAARPGVVYSGLIIDARGLGVRPALSPKIVDEMGNEVYGTGNVSREYAVQIGVVGYEKDINRARTNERVADNPMIVKALRATGPNRTDVVISNADAQLIRQAAQNLNFLEQCKVMIILD
ncbi:MAG: hypothetical protein GXO78_11765 [Calditrichaeota bacterium]|nr:hypothetical protein [Calditrichota bacterium]